MIQKIPFDWDFNEVLKVLRLRAEGKTWEVIAEEAHRGKPRVIEVNRWFKKLSWDQVSLFPEEIQRLRHDYLARKTMELKAKLEESRQRQPQVVVTEEVSAIELARAKHWDELAQVAAKLDAMWGEHLDSGRVIEDHDYIADVDLAWVESSSARFAYEVMQLLSHLKSEFSEEFEAIDSWSDLLKSPLPKGCLRRIMLVSKRRTFEGTCEICQEWQK